METTQTQKEIAQVSVTEAKKALEDKKDAQFIDVRTVGRIRGRSRRRRKESAAR